MEEILTEETLIFIRVLDKGFVELQDWMGDDKTVCQAARVSTLKESKGEESDKKLINYLMKEGHTSPFEMVEFKFRIHCPMFVRSQILRHRTANVNEVSRRYTSDAIEFFIPKEFRRQDMKDKQQSTNEDPITLIVIDTDVDGNNITVSVEDYMTGISNALHDEYQRLLAQGVCREQARMVLPTNLYTTFIFKIDLHNLLHFLDVRTTEHAQEETRLFAEAMEELIKDKVPVCYEAWKTWRKNGK